MKNLTILMCLLLIAGCTSSTEESPAPSKPAEGQWQARLMTPGGPLGFEMKLTTDGEGLLRMFILNGEESIEVPQVAMIGDSFIAYIDHYDSKLEAKVRAGGKRMEGTWKKRRGPNRWGELPFEADAGAGRRFPSASAITAAADFSGKWRVRFKSDSLDSVGIFNKTKNDTWEGTFLTATGDYRYLAGNQDGNRLRLSCFDGAHAFLFDFKQLEDGSLSGHFWNWNTWHDTWTAVRDDQAKLPDPFAQTKWNDDQKLETLSFPDLNGEQKSLGAFLPEGKARILYLFGSWCPNCQDATQFLRKMEAQFGADQLKVCGVAFELRGDLEKDAEQVRRYAKLHNISWPILIGGVADKKSATKAFRGVDFIRSYPTFVFITKTGRIAAVYSGFSGPATKDRYTDLERKMTIVIEKLLDT